jgi:hypothetical protein
LLRICAFSTSRRASCALIGLPEPAGGATLAIAAAELIARRTLAITVTVRPTPCDKVRCHRKPAPSTGLKRAEPQEINLQQKRRPGAPETNSAQRQGGACMKKKLVMTMTGEIFQPIRLYYRVPDAKKLRQAFDKLRCMSFEPVAKRWTWLFDSEAKSMKFKNSYSSIPGEKRPLVLGAFHTETAKHEIPLDVGSIERAVKAIEFFNERIGRATAELRYIAIYNKLFSDADLHPGNNFSTLFAEVETEEIDARCEAEAMRTIGAMKSGASLHDLPHHGQLVEAFPANYYDDGIELLNMSLQMRQIVAVKHWHGDMSYSIGDLIASMTSG